MCQSDGFLRDNSNAAQRLLDGVNLVAQSVSELSVKPAKAVTSWLTDQIAPAYWKPNSLILVSDTHTHASPSSAPNPRAKSTLLCPEGCLVSAAAAAIAPGHQIKTFDRLRLSPLPCGSRSITACVIVVVCS